MRARTAAPWGCGELGVTVRVAARKFTQEIHADVGDKSVFMLQAMSEPEREVFLAEARASGRGVWD